MAALGSANLDCRQDGARLDATRREFYLFNAGIAAIEEADALLLIGSNPRHEAPVLNARIRKRFLHGNIPIGAIGAAADLTYPADFLGDSPALLNALHDGGHRLRAQTLRRGEAADVDRGPRRAGAARRGGGAGGGVAACRGGGRARPRVARLQRAAYRGGARGRARSRLPARRARPRHGRDAGRRRRSAVAAGCGRVRHRAHRRGHVRRLSGPSRRPRRRARRRYSSGRRLHRKERHLRQHRRPGAARIPRGVRAGRGARGLEDPARVQRGDRPAAALRRSRRAAPAAGRNKSRVRPRGRARAARGVRPGRAGRRSGGAVGRAGRVCDRRLLPDQPDQPRQSRRWRSARACSCGRSCRLRNRRWRSSSCTRCSGSLS